MTILQSINNQNALFILNNYWNRYQGYITTGSDIMRSIVFLLIFFVISFCFNFLMIFTVFPIFWSFRFVYTTLCCAFLNNHLCSKSFPIQILVSCVSHPNKNAWFILSNYFPSLFVTHSLKHLTFLYSMAFSLNFGASKVFPPLLFFSSKLSDVSYAPFDTLSPLPSTHEVSLLMIFYAFQILQFFYKTAICHGWHQIFCSIFLLKIWYANAFNCFQYISCQVLSHF